MLRVWVCAAHMGWFWAQNSQTKGLFIGRFSLNMGGFSRNWRKIAKVGGFPPKFIITVGMTGVLAIRRGYLSENLAAHPPSVRKSCTPSPR